MGRIAGGVRAIKLEKDDEVVAMELVEPGQELLVVTKKGFGKENKGRRLQDSGSAAARDCLPTIRRNSRRQANLWVLWQLMMTMKYF